MSMQFEHFDDFTIASSWERFISKIEAICRLWMADGPNNLLEKGAIPLANFKNSYKIKSELQYDLIAPQSASSVVLDAPEASRLLSAVAIAMSNSLRDYARTSSYGFCAGVVNFLFLDAGFNRNHSSEVPSPVAGYLPDYMDYQVGMRPQIPVERKWASGFRCSVLLG
ncbi:uncharacterized protein DS421_14g464780 [Arachis hypogaea]|nr:uncharacterized protein DS421_14g464780 [Arachis hypogaea]